MASGCVVVASNEALKDVLDDLFIDNLDRDHVGDALRRALALETSERNRRARELREYIESNNSLSLLAEKLQKFFGEHVGPVQRATY